uniref:Uncharacterized protein n=1 Tax=viral metagenome TaxID=1070528 RepID=A0A6C0KKT1_9ZZZZ
MKFRPVYIAIIVVLFIIIMIVSSAGTTFVPYSKDALFSREYPYEGIVSGAAAAAPVMQGNANAAPVIQGNVAVPAESEKPVSMLGTVAGWFGASPSCNTGKCTKVEGFALQPAPFAESPAIDRFGKTPAGPECIGQGSGYAKSVGPLCMSEEDKRMLSTRGGNSTGSDSAIGQP